MALRKAPHPGRPARSLHERARRVRSQSDRTESAVEGRTADVQRHAIAFGVSEDLAASARICLGIITGAHGVRGGVRIKSFTAEPQAIARYGALETEAGDRRFELEITGEGKGVLIARIEGIGDRDAAERLKGTRLYVQRAALPPPEAEEFYQADLVGLEARRSDGTLMGRVSAVHDFGAGASLEIEDAAGKSLLVPFTRAAVPQIDIAGGSVVIVPPEGLIDAAKAAEGAGA